MCNTSSLLFKQRRRLTVRPLEGAKHLLCCAVLCYACFLSSRNSFARFDSERTPFSRHVMREDLVTWLGRMKPSHSSMHALSYTDNRH
jgi:hypothetical protein